VTLPFRGAHPVAVCSHFFEFIDGDGSVSPLEALRHGKRYAVVVTTSGGLYRYRTGDEVEVTGHSECTPTLRFVGRGARVSDVCGEKLSEAFVADVIRRLQSRLPQAARFAMLAPEKSAAGAPWHYQLFSADDGVSHLAAELDRELRANPHYALCRDLGQLGPAGITPVTADAARIYLATETSRGLRLGDIKPTALSPHTGWSQRFDSTVAVRTGNSLTRD
jgi:hypothetical protein